MWKVGRFRVFSGIHVYEVQMDSVTQACMSWEEQQQGSRAAG
jgi:hypothetical protein